MSRTHAIVLVLVAAAAAVWLVQDGTISSNVIIAIAVLVPAVVLHEVSHGVAALAFGDDTAKRAGRLSLSPLAHVDPFGTVVLPAMLAIATAGAATFGYAKPVPVNPRRMRNPLNHGLLVSLAGPGMNIALALAAAVLFRALQLDPYDDKDFTTRLVGSFGSVNVVLAVFNLLPIPPLDGSALVERVLPMRYWEPYLRLRQYSIGLVLLLVFVFPLDRLFNPAVDLWARLLT